MKSNIKNFLSVYLLLIGFFLFSRLFFLAYYSDKWPDAGGWSEALASLLYAIPLDVAMASIYAIIPWLLLALNTLFYSRLWLWFLRAYMALVLFFHGWLSVVELGVYGEWEEKPTYDVLLYLKHPTEAFESAEWGVIFKLGLLSIALIGAIYWLVKKLIKTEKLDMPFAKSSGAVFILLVPVLILLLARGGTNEIPITSSDVFHSHIKFFNDATVNTDYHFVHSILDYGELLSGNSPWLLDEAQKKPGIVEPLLNQGNCDSPKILSSDNPNVVLIILESYSADLVESSGGYKGISPNLEKLIAQGVLFPESYAVGTLSHEGMAAVLSGFPHVPRFPITNLPKKFNQIPTISKSLEPLGYDSLFQFGGQLRYGNIKSFVYNAGYDKIFEEDDFPAEYPHGQLGVHDEFSLDFFEKNINQLKEPFLASIFTTSSHSPYDHPMEWKIDWGGEERPFLNSANYTDHSLGQFFERVKKEPWYQNTLFVLIADHGHITPRHWSRAQKQWRKVPFILFGEVIKPEYRGKKFDQVVSQVDVASTVLGQLGIDHAAYPWSRDVLCSDYTPSAYFANNNGFGFITSEGYVSYDFSSDRVMYFEAGKGNNDASLQTKLIEQGRHYLDYLFRKFNEL